MNLCNTRCGFLFINIFFPVSFKFNDSSASVLPCSFVIPFIPQIHNENKIIIKKKCNCSHVRIFFSRQKFNFKKFILLNNYRNLHTIWWWSSCLEDRIKLYICLTEYSLSWNYHRNNVTLDVVVVVVHVFCVDFGCMFYVDFIWKSLMLCSIILIVLF